MAWKYVIMRIGNQEVPVIFPERIVHAHMAGALKALFAAEAQAIAGGILSDRAVKQIAEEVKAVSAGQIGRLYVDGVGGSSETLDLKARPDDGNAINAHPYTHGYVGRTED